MDGLILKKDGYPHFETGSIFKMDRSILKMDGYPHFETGSILKMDGLILKIDGYRYRENLKSINKKRGNQQYLFIKNLYHNKLNQTMEK